MAKGARVRAVDMAVTLYGLAAVPPASTVGKQQLEPGVEKKKKFADAGSAVHLESCREVRESLINGVRHRLQIHTTGGLASERRVARSCCAADNCICMSCRSLSRRRVGHTRCALSIATSTSQLDIRERGCPL